MIFIDTGAFLARHVPVDQFHKKSLKIWKRLEQTPDALSTSVHVLNETLTLLPRQNATKNLSTWSSDFAAFLSAIFDHRDFARHRVEDHAMIESLSEAARGLHDFQALACHFRLDPAVSFTSALLFFIFQIENASLPAPAGEASVEMLGWLELPLDDAPLLVIAGFNEGNIPERPRQDGFLPDSVRAKIGLTSSRSRFARDLYQLTSIIHSRPNLAIISGRRSADENPLLPSRLLLRQEPEKLPDAIRRFYGHDVEIVDYH